MGGLILGVNTLYRVFCFFKLFIIGGKEQFRVNVNHTLYNNVSKHQRRGWCSINNSSNTLVRGCQSTYAYGGRNTTYYSLCKNLSWWLSSAHNTVVCIKDHPSQLQYSFPYIKTPVFVLNSDYDTAQLSGNLQLPCLPPNCSEEQMKYFYQFRVVSNQLDCMDRVTMGHILSKCHSNFFVNHR